MAQQITVINSLGTMIGWNKVTMRLWGRDVVGIRKIAYKDETELEVEYGAGQMPVGMSEGNYKAEISIELTQEEVLAIQSAMPRGARIQDAQPTPITVAYEYQNQVFTDVIQNVRFMGRGVDVKQGDKTIATELKGIATHINWNV